MLKSLVSNPLAASGSRSVQIGALVFRLGIGLMMALGHGWGKLTSFGELSAGFPDPLGVGSPASAALAISAEFACSLLITVGLLTRVATVPLIITMLVAALSIHADDPFARKEKALLYLCSYLAITCMGAGRLSLDYVLGRRFGRTSP